ncbi:MAG: alanine/glycine:cation symporter family protein, partial [Candidatus Binatia bacterium]
MTVRLRFIQFSQFGHSVKVIMGKYDDPDDEGDINHFQALSAALSATIGIGNIAGVATAIHWGGPGALFWMWVTGFFGMALKYTECSLSHKFRVVHPDGSVSGGPMYYIERGLGPRFKWVGVLFAIFLVIGSFNTPNMVQSNTVAVSLLRDFDIPNIITGMVLASLVGLVVVGGIKRLGQVASRLVPTMTVVYVTGALYILTVHLPVLPEAFATIFRDAFTPTAQAGGFFGSAWILTLTWGVKRGLFSNEAGQGSAPIAHAAAKTKESVREGIVALMGPFLDTLVVCSMTGLVIISTGVWNDKFEDTLTGGYLTEVTYYRGAPADVDAFNLDGQELYSGILHVVDGRIGESVWIYKDKGTIEQPLILTSRATEEMALYTGTIFIGEAGKWDLNANPGEEFALRGKMMLTGATLTAQGFRRGLPGNWGNYLVTIAVLLFAYSTAIAWSYYGDRAIEYLFGARAIRPYRVVFTFFIFMGANLTLNMVWTFGDIALGLMAFPNLIGLLVLSNLTVRMTKEYTSRKHLTYKEYLEQKSQQQTS